MVRLYLPRFSMTNALCCGTTVAVRATTMTASTARKMTTIVEVSMDCSCQSVSAVRLYEQSQAMHLHDAGAGTGRNRPVTVVAYGPVTAAVLDPGALTGSQGRGQGQQGAGLPRLHLGQITAQ